MQSTWRGGSLSTLRMPSNNLLTKAMTRSTQGSWVWCILGAHEATERTQAPLQTSNLITYASHTSQVKEWHMYSKQPLQTSCEQSNSMPSAAANSPAPPRALPAWPASKDEIKYAWGRGKVRLLHAL